MAMQVVCKLFEVNPRGDVEGGEVRVFIVDPSRVDAWKETEPGCLTEWEMRVQSAAGAFQ